MGTQLQRGRTMPLWLKVLLVAAILLAYVGIAALVVYFISRSGAYPDGSDTMFYVYRGDFLYRSITQEGNWLPLIDMQWYNGVQTWRYWSPLSAYILAGCQAIMGGDCFQGYLLCVGVFYFLGAFVWLLIGLTHDRPWMGAFLGALWFLAPNNAFMFFGEGVLARAMSMAVLPWFVVSVHDYLYRPRQRRWSALPQMIVSFLLIIMSHIGWAGMVAITLLIFLLFYRLVHHRKEQRAPVFPIIVCLLLAFLLTGIWALPSLRGGITGIDSSSIMKNFFQTLNMSVNPFYGWSSGGGWNRWDNIPGNPYFGCVAFLLCLFGIFFGRKKTFPGFAAALAVCLLTTTAAYPILVLMPGAQYLWMLRFISIALTFLFVSFFLWTSLKKRFQALVALLLVAEILAASPLILVDQNGLTPQERYTAAARETLIDTAWDATKQRSSAVEPIGPVAGGDGVYLLAGFGNKAVPTSYGQGVQAAANYHNIVHINQAAENGQFLYMFDRCLEMGNDTVLVPVSQLRERYRDIDALDAAAAQVGYGVIDANDACRLYQLKDVPSAPFGVASKYRAICIGSGASDLALDFPAAEEPANPCLDEYTYEELSQYDVIYLAGFTYHHLPSAEELILRLSENGVRVIILADGIPADEHTGAKSFLGVSCNTVNFQNGYPALDTVDGVLYCDLFASGHSKDWKTVYLNGLTDVWGTITDVPEGKMDFYGTGKNENLIYIGLALTYHYALTRDPAVGALLSHALNMSSTELPQRKLVPLQIDYRDNVITIDSPQDGVNTTLATHDIFDADRPLSVQHNLLVVDQGRTVIRLRYPYLVPGACLSAAGLLSTVAYLIIMKKRLKAAPPPDEAPAEENTPEKAPSTPAV